MKLRLSTIILIITLFLTSAVTAQDTVSFENLFMSGISVKYGAGYYSVKDEFISKEKYSGILPVYGVEWSRFRSNYGYRLGFEYHNSSNIKNNNITAEVQQFAFNQDFIYSVGSVSLFSEDIYFFLGPSLQYWFYQVNYDFVQPGTFIFSKTFGNMGSLGINAEFIYPLSTKLNIDGSLRSNLLSVAGKLIDEKVFNETSPRFVTVFTATKFDFDLFLHYNLISRISISLGYEFDLSRIDRWDPYIAASDNIIISLNYRF